MRKPEFILAGYSSKCKDSFVRRQTILKNLPFVILLLLLSIPCDFLLAQEDSTAMDSVATKKERDFRRVDVFPAISYSPETKLTLGAIGYYYMDLSRDKDNTTLSNLSFLAIYTTAKQVAIESKAELFFPEDKWRLRGEVFYNHYPDRNYGSGNDASVTIVEFRENESKGDTVNYLSINTDRIKFSPVVLRRLKSRLYLGIQTDIEYIYNYKPLYSFRYLSPDSNLIKNLPVNGLRSGIGLQLLYDSRDYILNPIEGFYIEVGNLHYGRATFSDSYFSSFKVDARAYINPVLNHTIGLRTMIDFRTGEGPYALRSYGRVGGRDFLRGYFQGTYQDKSLLGFEIEYRMPFWREDSESKFWQIWKRLGIVVFGGAAQVSDKFSKMQIDEFRLAVGGGLRVLFSKDSRVNIRIDYAVGLHKDSGGPGKRQKGLYFYLAESF